MKITNFTSEQCRKKIYIYFKLFGVGYFTQAGKIKNGSLKFSAKILF